MRDGCGGTWGSSKACCFPLKRIPKLRNGSCHSDRADHSRRRLDSLPFCQACPGRAFARREPTAIEVGGAQPQVDGAAAVWNLHALDWVVTISQAMADGLARDFDVPEQMLQVVYNGIHPPGVALTSGGVGAPAWSDANAVTICFAGGILWLKGAGIMLRICRLLDRSSLPWRVLWLGEAQPTGRFRALLDMPKVKWIGRVSRDEVLRHLADSHVLAMPSRSEGCPILLLEALSLGVVPLVSDCPSAMREIVTDGACRRALSLRPRDWMRAIQSLVSDPKQWEAYSGTSASYFRANLTIAECGSALRQLLQRRRRGFTPPRVNIDAIEIRSFHRRPFQYPKWDPRGVFQRLNTYLGILPPVISD